MEHQNQILHGSDTIQGKNDKFNATKRIFILQKKTSPKSCYKMIYSTVHANYN